MTVSNHPEEGGGVIVNRWPLARAGTSSVAWSVSGPRGFQSALHVPTITLSENRFGVISGQNNVIRLVAPRYYTWSFHTTAPVHNLSGGQLGNVISGRPGQHAPLSVTGGGIGGGGSFTTVAISAVETSRPTGLSTEHHVIYIHLADIVRNQLWNPGLGTLEINNLWLVPDDHAPNVGDVNIRVEYGTITTANTSVTPNPWVLGNPANRNFGRVGSSNLVSPILSAGQVVESLTVGRRGMVGLNVEVHDGPNNLRTGHLGNFRVANYGGGVPNPYGGD
jgi:hypothetical protein